tara:strand:- start:7119 stop:7262 length:144 start_codon:yes stop_codon:yes gene_type:complete
MKHDLIESNVINLSAIGVSLANVETLLTILVLFTALVYNIKRIVDND